MLLEAAAEALREASGTTRPAAAEPRRSKRHAAVLAREAADRLQRAIREAELPIPTVAIQLGTGWGDAVVLERQVTLSFADVHPLFGRIDALEGHNRRIIIGMMGDVCVIALSGRFHLNERPGCDPEIYDAVRLQIEMLTALGVKTFVLTNAAGSLVEEHPVGSLVIMKGMLTLFAPALPLYGGEFYPICDLLHTSLQDLAFHSVPGGLAAKSGVYAMVRGPYFEGIIDKMALVLFKATVVGMSTVPELAVVAATGGTGVVAVTFVTNNSTEPHAHETNVARVREKAPLLAIFLQNLVAGIHARNHN